jgi:hypothetical protein
VSAPETLDDPQAWLTMSEAAAALARSDQWVRDRIHEGRLPGAVRTRYGHLVPRSAIAVELARRGEPADAA